MRGRRWRDAASTEAYDFVSSRTFVIEYADALAQAEQVPHGTVVPLGSLSAAWALERLGRGSDAVATLEEAARCSSNNR